MTYPALHVPASIVVGGGCRREVANLLIRYGVRRPLVVTDRGVCQLEVVDDVLECCRHSGLAPVLFTDVQPDPTDTNVLAGLERLRSERCDGVVAVGGGSPIDAAKAIAVLATNAGPLEHYAGYHKVPHAGLPLIAIPTTAGTGSEVTRVAVITDTHRQVKMMILSVYMTPTAALVDYESTLTMPPALTAAVGIDTLTHGIEAYVSRRAHGLTDPLALACVSHVTRHLHTACRQPDQREARAGMMLAACLGGMAFANASVCLVHGMSRPLGALYHVPHGLSNAMLLPIVTGYSLSAAPQRYAELSRLLEFVPPQADDAAALEALVPGLERWNAELGIPRLRDYFRGVDEASFDASLPKMADDALASGSPQNNPRVPTAEEIVALYRAAFADSRGA
ncbi:MAG: iron-containing alcohol dehydrogenase [Pirellulales bacterium]